MIPCSQPDCTTPARYTVNATGYPMPMFSGCCDHLTTLLERDVRMAKGSTESWTVKVIRR